MRDTEDNSSSGATSPRRDPRLLRVIGMSRYAAGLAVVGTFVAATALLIHGATEVVHLVAVVLAPGGARAAEQAASPPMLLGISAVDAFLVAIVLYVMAIGFYQLFFHPLPLPAWLVIEDLGQLEHKLVGVVISALGIVFLGEAVTWDGRRDLQGFGIATATVIGALAYFLRRVAQRDVATAARSERPAPGNESETVAQPIANDSARRSA